MLTRTRPSGAGTVAIARAARGLASGRLYDRAGHLGASCSQEELIRWEDGRS